MQAENDELWGNAEPATSKPTKSDHVKECVDLEMKKYISLPIVDRKMDPIKWWFEVGKSQFPTLFLAAQKYQCMTATSVPSERVFSIAGNIVTKKRNSLGTQCVNEIVTLHHNWD